MYGMNYSGGANKTHGQVEQVQRVDSFEAAHMDDLGTLFAEGADRLSRSNVGIFLTLRAERLWRCMICPSPWN